MELHTTLLLLSFVHRLHCHVLQPGLNITVLQGWVYPGEMLPEAATKQTLQEEWEGVLKEKFPGELNIYEDPKEGHLTSKRVEEHTKLNPEAESLTTQDNQEPERRNNSENKERENVGGKDGKEKKKTIKESRGDKTSQEEEVKEKVAKDHKAVTQNSHPTQEIPAVLTQIDISHFIPDATPPPTLFTTVSPSQTLNKVSQDVTPPALPPTFSLSAISETANKGIVQNAPPSTTQSPGSLERFEDSTPLATSLSLNYPNEVIVRVQNMTDSLYKGEDRATTEREVRTGHKDITKSVTPNAPNAKDKFSITFTKKLQNAKKEAQKLKMKNTKGHDSSPSRAVHQNKTGPTQLIRKSPKSPQSNTSVATQKTILAQRPTVQSKPNPTRQEPKSQDKAKPRTRDMHSTKATSNKQQKTQDEKAKSLGNTKRSKHQKKKAILLPTPFFPYFKDDYCPTKCACYGRVVQCSDKGVDSIPYGIPYNALYVLLMNNHIEGIQMDLLAEYVSMELLVLSNNRLTDGSIEGSFEGIQNLKRLYLDRNLLQSVPADLPASLEELHLDGNNMSVVSDSVWSRCPGLLILSLNNNSLGVRSDSLAKGVFSPLATLKTLSLNHNQIRAVPSQLPLSLRELYLRGNLIKKFGASTFTGKSELLILDLSANQLTNKGLGKGALLNTDRLESLNLEGNLLTQVPRHLPPSLKTLNLEGNTIKILGKTTFKRFPHLEHLGLSGNKIITVVPGAFHALPVLHQLDLSHNDLQQVPRQLPASLHVAVLTHNRISSVPRDAFCPRGSKVSFSRLVRVQLENNLIDMAQLDTQAFACLRGFQVVHFY
ncbi:extracellular matrix protein 2 [Denticeps clupeoides]|uniref:LRRNT domain-containing protein n=1 Tax=Denticeps clupeoides TaxID=299321 RepID=A0AAY4DJK0_9TELE|nr:extracellular matrix protein 2-like [Denticeps clupeoides]XP_028809677.1 extracellular matrix protein 2-like [Denticeps clupeoides]XP_028809678.1 extracellular matrix protein 2-like [Denticeps clupeoides]